MRDLSRTLLLTGHRIQSPVGLCGSSGEAVLLAALEFTSGPVYEPPPKICLVSWCHALHLTKHGIPELAAPPDSPHLGPDDVGSFQKLDPSWEDEDQQALGTLGKGGPQALKTIPKEDKQCEKAPSCWHRHEPSSGTRLRERVYICT